MKHFENILYHASPAETASPALEQVFRLARDHGARLTLVSVVEPVPLLAQRLLPAGVDVAELVEERARRTLDSLAEAGEAAGVTPRTRLLRGKPFVELVRDVLEYEHDLLVTTGQGEDGGLLGGLSQHLMRKCPCPVWVLNADADRLTRVVAAVDVSEEASRDLHLRVVALARWLAGAHGVPLQVVHAWDLQASHLIESRLAREEYERWLADLEVTAGERLRELVKQAGTPDAACTLLRGHHSTALLEHLDGDPNALLVMGSIARAGIAGVLIGNTAERLLGQVRGAVLAIKPEEFQSPISPRPREEARRPAAS